RRKKRRHAAALPNQYPIRGFSLFTHSRPAATTKTMTGENRPSRIRKLMDKASTALSNTVLQVAPTLFHRWYYDTGVWQKTTWMGVPALKSPMDMWNYQEILFSLKPSVIIEFGSRNGGSTLFFASIMRELGSPFKILAVDVDTSRLSQKVLADP